MKIKREDLGKLIVLLQELYDTKDDIINIQNAFKVPEYKDSFVVPDNWYLNRTKNQHYWNILHEWLNTTNDVEKGHPGGQGWETKYAGDYTLYYIKNNKYFAGTNTKVDDSYVEITWEQFEKYIYKKNK